MVKLGRRFKGSTLIEVLVAMTLIVTAISFFFLSVGNIKKSFNVDLKTYALTVLNKHLQDVDTVALDDEIIDYSSFILKKTISPYNQNPDLFIISIAAFSNDGEKLLEERRIIFYKKSMK
jgi:hypothetical protein